MQGEIIEKYWMLQHNATYAYIQKKFIENYYIGLDIFARFQNFHAFLIDEILVNGISAKMRNQGSTASEANFIFS